MDRYFLDSSAILEILDGSKKGRDIAAMIADSDMDTSVICYCEVLNKANLDKQASAEAFLSSLSILPVSLADCFLAKNYQLDCRKRGRQVATNDCLIAASASNNDSTIITVDSDFSRIEGVKRHVF